MPVAGRVFVERSQLVEHQQYIQRPIQIGHRRAHVLVVNADYHEPVRGQRFEHRPEIGRKAAIIRRVEDDRVRTARRIWLDVGERALRSLGPRNLI